MKNEINIDRWYDRHIRSWVIQRKDSEGNQIGDSVYVYSKPEAIKAEEEMNIEEIRKAWKFLREKNNSIPDEIIDLMRDAAIEKIESAEMATEKMTSGMRVEAIYSFTFGQKIILLPCVNEIFSSKQILSKFLCSAIPESHKKKLCKISCCVSYTEKDQFSDPEWFVEAKGKLYYDDQGNLLNNSEE